MKTNLTAVLMLLVCCCGLAALAEDRPAPLLQADMEQEPLKLGWWRGGPTSERPVAEWYEGCSVSGRHSLFVRQGWWSSPRVEVRPLT